MVLINVIHTTWMCGIKGTEHILPLCRRHFVSAARWTGKVWCCTNKMGTIDCFRNKLFHGLQVAYGPVCDPWWVCQHFLFSCRHNHAFFFFIAACECHHCFINSCVYHQGALLVTCCVSATYEFQRPRCSRQQFFSLILLLYCLVCFTKDYLQMKER